jgi:hypothetical protein
MDKCTIPVQPAYTGIVVTSIILVLILIGTSKSTDYYTVVNNWGEYRCQLEIMLFASLFGHDTMENLEFCLGVGFNARAANTVTPFYDVLGSFTKVLTTFLASINSVRMVFATIVGSVSQVFSEFTMRVQALMYSIQASAARMKFLMNRVHGTMFSMMHMGMSGIQSYSNFTQTPLFNFLTFMSCFPPETEIEVVGKGKLNMKDIRLGDSLKDNIRVTGIVSILGDGQQMIDMEGISVSATHYIKEGGKWILSQYSTRGKRGEIWNGGVARPLSCLVTSTNTIPIGNLTFSDYHENEDADRETMNRILGRLNGGENSLHLHKNYITGVDPETDILLEDGSYCPAHSIRLGTRVKNGVIMGIIVRECSTFTEYNGEKLGYATAVWKGKQWLRGKEMSIESGTCINFAVYPSAIIETRKNLLRDMFEIHDLDIQSEYVSSMKNRA